MPARRPARAKTRPAAKRRTDILAIQRVYRAFAENPLVIKRTQPRAFPQIKVRGYDSARKILERVDFKMLGDFTMTIAGAATTPATFARLFYNSALAAIATYYEMPGLGAVIDFDTEFANGGFLSTTTAPAERQIGSPMLIQKLQLARETPIAIASALHMIGIVAYAEANHTHRRPLPTLAAIKKAFQRQHALKGAEMRAKQAIPEAEFKRMMTGRRLRFPKDKKVFLAKWQA